MTRQRLEHRTLTFRLYHLATNPPPSEHVSSLSYKFLIFSGFPYFYYVIEPTRSSMHFTESNSEFVTIFTRISKKRATSKYYLTHRLIVQIRRMEILLLSSFFYVLLCSSMARKNIMLIATYFYLKWKYWSFNDAWELDVNTFRRKRLLFFIFETFSARAILFVCCQTSQNETRAIRYLELRARIEEHRRMATIEESPFF